MAEILFFHHVQGLTPGVRAMVRELEAQGHLVHAPDFFGGVHPVDIPAGVDLVDQLGESVLAHRIDEVVKLLGPELVYMGTSWGAMQAQRLAQQRPGARGAILLEGFVDLHAPWSFGPWPASVPAQIHGMEQDPFFAGEGDLAAAEEFVAGPGAGIAELYTYPGSAHLFTDGSLPAHDQQAYRLLMQRVSEFLAKIDGGPHPDA